MRRALSFCAMLLLSCGGDTHHTLDAGPTDGGARDGGDAGDVDANLPDAALPPIDGGPVDAGPRDAGHDGGGPIDPPAVCPTRCRYVRAGATAGGDGSDWDHALLALPATLTRGFSYFVAAGSYPAYTFDDAESGVTYISVRKATATDHGTDTGWMAGYAGAAATFAAIQFATGYVVLDGREGGGPDLWDTGFGFEVSRATTMPLEKLVEYDGQPWNVVMRHVDIHPASTAFEVYGIYDGGFSGEISSCYVHDLMGTAFEALGRWNGLVFAHTFVARATFATVVAAGLSDRGSDNVTIRDSLFEDVSGIAALAEIGGPESADNWNVHGNVFACSEPSTSNLNDVIGVYADATNHMMATNWRVYDNSVVNVHGRASMSFGSGSTGVRVDDNLWFCNFTTALDRYVDIVGATHDYDYYSSCVLGPSFVTGAHEPTAHTTAFGSVSDPHDDPFVDWRNHDYRLHAPLVFGGVPYPGLADPAFDSTDPVGLTRGSDGIWDRGAYELP